ncbi:hypothetical protein JRF84_14065 [Methylobacterium organophilum]|mgnify:CR=1 FL=1|uniref:phage tail assembly chaperone n=1 Tax=Methylobacterium organophilum TaxID=410 RepID=UPI0019D22102|nr:hypothetical protein [Methylobacterium organophilum]MBN6820704.1 hypothetical protein [Methylobacterium organophilum]
MARRETRITWSGEDRDNGKVFVLTEMSARQAEEWAGRALTTLTRAGAELPDEVLNGGMAAFAAMGVQALSGLQWDDISPLMDEMFSCVRIQPNPAQPTVVRDLVEDDIEEVLTRVSLRKEILLLHIRPTNPGARSTSGLPGTPDFPVGGEITRTSPQV